MLSIIKYLLFSISSLVFMCIVNIQSNTNKLNPNDYLAPIIFTPASLKLNREEKFFIKKYNPYGVLFLKRNIKNHNQFTNLIQNIELTYQKYHKNKPQFFIDQEGGLVNNLRYCFPEATKYKSQFEFGLMVEEKGLEYTKEQVKLQSKEMALELKKLGIQNNLAPVVDVLLNKADGYEIEGKTNYLLKDSDIKSRSFSDDPQIVIELTNAFIQGHKEIGIATCSKHLLGLGRATVNSHITLPVITASMEELLSKDAIPFQNVTTDYAMIGHAIYTAIDPANVSTISPKFINFIKQNIIKNEDTLLLSDALTMGAIANFSLKDLVLNIYETGIDLTLVNHNIKDYKKEIYDTVEEMYKLNIINEETNKCLLKSLK